jgi:hypothetical protein
MAYPKARKKPKWITDKIYHDVFGTYVNYENPKTLNEKIHWLKFYSDTSKWQILADKYRVREYVANKGFGSILMESFEQCRGSVGALQSWRRNS